MKIVVIGGTGTLGQAIVKQLKPRHHVIVASYQYGDICVDITDMESIKQMYQTIGDIDAVIAATGKVKFAHFSDMTTDDYYLGIHNKLMGQVNLVLIGKDYLNAGGSFTLTSGILNHDPIRTGSAAAMINGALEGFVKGVAIEMPNNLRINLVSPTVFIESMPLYENYFRGFEPIPAAKAALSYTKSVEGSQTGQIYRVGY
jgi:NAD(P)-dependent dehydrogenase (short-subunit alcohol dehydrogenase family)